MQRDVVLQFFGLVDLQQLHKGSPHSILHRFNMDCCSDDCLLCTIEINQFASSSSSSDNNIFLTIFLAAVSLQNSHIHTRALLLSRSLSLSLLSDSVLFLKLLFLIFTMQNRKKSFSWTKPFSRWRLHVCVCACVLRRLNIENSTQ